MTTKHKFIAAVTLIAAIVPLASSLSLAEAKEEKEKPQLMFVQTAEDLKANDKTLRLVNVGQQTLYFSDRPSPGADRRAHHPAGLHGGMDSECG